MSGSACPCLTNPLENLEPFQDLGMDRHFAEVSLLVCRECGQYWLRYFFELEAFTGSGSWYLGPIPAQQRSKLSAETAKSILEGLDWYDYGGSYFHGRRGRTSGPIYLP